MMHPKNKYERELIREKKEKKRAASGANPRRRATQAIREKEAEDELRGLSTLTG